LEKELDSSVAPRGSERVARGVVDHQVAQPGRREAVPDFRLADRQHEGRACVRLNAAVVVADGQIDPPSRERRGVMGQRQRGDFGMVLDGRKLSDDPPIRGGRKGGDGGDARFGGGQAQSAVSTAGRRT
jgi:hypothetical protein